MESLLERFVVGAIVALIVSGTPMLIKLGKGQKANAIEKGKVYYGLLGYRILMFIILGILSSDTILMILLGDRMEGRSALILMLLLSIPFAAIYIVLYRRSFTNKYLADFDISTVAVNNQSKEGHIRKTTNSIFWFNILLVVLCVLIIVSLFIFISSNRNQTNAQSSMDVLKIENAELKKEIASLQQANNALNENLQYYEGIIAFFDEFVVFVEDDGTNWYHKYECNRFVASSFWAYNVDAAEDEGFSACPYCFD